MVSQHSKVLSKALDIYETKMQDYQNPKSSVQQVDYYPRGVLTILDIMHGKMLRLRSLIEAYEHNPNHSPNYESLEDNVLDLINYAAFFVTFLDEKMVGQDNSKDMLNRSKDGY
jgi:hypothetical protein